MKKRTYLPRRWALTCGNLEKLLSLPVADSLGVNVNESEREQSGIIPRQFCVAPDECGPFFEVPMWVYLSDLQDNRIYGGFHMSTNIGLFYCNLLDKECHSEAEWNGLVKPYMEDAVTTGSVLSISAAQGLTS